MQAKYNVEIQQLRQKTLFLSLVFILNCLPKAALIRVYKAKCTEKDSVKYEEESFKLHLQ